MGINLDLIDFLTTGELGSAKIGMSHKNLEILLEKFGADWIQDYGNGPVLIGFVCGKLIFGFDWSTRIVDEITLTFDPKDPQFLIDETKNALNQLGVFWYPKTLDSIRIKDIVQTLKAASYHVDKLVSTQTSYSFIRVEVALKNGNFIYLTSNDSGRDLFHLAVSHKRAYTEPSYKREAL